jgi:hypothetical protein
MSKYIAKTMHLGKPKISYNLERYTTRSVIFGMLGEELAASAATTSKQTYY